MNHLSIIRSLSVLAAGILGAPLLQADLTISASPSVPEEAAIIEISSESPSNSAVAWYFTRRDPMAKRDIAQTIFFSNDGEIKQISIKLAGAQKENFLAQSEVALNIYESAEAPEKSPEYKKIASKQEGTIELNAGDEGYLHFALDEAIPVKAGHYYSFVFIWRSAQEFNKISFSQTEGSAQSYRWHRMPGSSWAKSAQSLLISVR